MMTDGRILRPVPDECYVELGIVDRVAAIEGGGRMVESMNAVRSSFTRLSEAVSDFTVEWPTPLLDQWDETSARDTGHCAATGVRWSDLMAQIGELTDET